MKLPEFCQALEARIAATEPSRRLSVIALALQQAFRVRDDEVALLRLDLAKEALAFVWPERLRDCGSIPVASRESQAARTVRDNRPQSNNRFATTMHASIFEQVQLDKAKAVEKIRPEPIQKIMSAPLATATGCVGVVQLCRKGSDPAAAGPDFTPVELEALATIAGVIGRYL